MHGEADAVAAFAPRRVLDLGCGTGRVAIELAHRGVEAVGVDLDADLVAIARRRAPGVRFVVADAARCSLGEVFDVVVLAGNVVVFCRPEDRPGLAATAAAHLAPGGRLLCGWSATGVAPRVDPDDWDRWCAQAGLERVVRWSTWDGAPWPDPGVPVGEGYTVAVHRRPG